MERLRAAVSTPIEAEKQPQVYKGTAPHTHTHKCTRTSTVEFNETFSLSLSLVSIASTVTIDPNTAQITIVDDES